MNIFDSIYIHYYKWYDRDSIGMKKEKAPENSAMLLGLTVMLWLILFAVAVCKIFSFSFYSFPTIFVTIAGIVIAGLCYNIYLNRGFGIYRSDTAANIRSKSRAQLITYLLFMNLLPAIL